MPALSTGAIKCCCFAPSGEIFATGSYDHNAIIWDSNSGKEIRMLRAHTHSVETCGFSNNSFWLCTGSWDCSAIIWSVKVKYCLVLFAHTLEHRTVSLVQGRILLDSNMWVNVCVFRRVMLCTLAQVTQVLSSAARFLQIPTTW